MQTRVAQQPTKPQHNQSQPTQRKTHAATDTDKKTETKCPESQPAQTQSTHEDLILHHASHVPQVQMGKVQQRPPPPRIPEEPSEGEDQNFASDTNTIANTLIKISQVSPVLHDIRDTDMDGAITYALLELEGVDTEPDINDIGKKGPWVIYAKERLHEAI
jgi:hypothetical protein